ncbi:MAG: hypothetical protein JEY71_04840 [Sphaerochaeta sp.]|nr:hypothetical protein [Sphaerochaeta sp.]
MNIKRIIGLYGSKDKGKSRTLYLLGKLLIEKGAVILRSEGISEDFFNDDPIKENGTACDFKALFTLNGKTIGITTQGDNEDELNLNINFLSSTWDIVFSATRTSGKTKDVLIKFAKDNHAELLWVKKLYLNDSSLEVREIGNEKQAAELFLEI